MLACSNVYVIADLGYLELSRLGSFVRQILPARPAYVQLRAKGHEAESLSTHAAELQSMCRDYGVKFILNDHVALAKHLGLDGVHIGQDDGNYRQVREYMGQQAVIGRSTHSLAQAATALAEGFDYIGFGPLYPTPTKAGRACIGLDDVQEVNALGAAADKQVFCIGGIKPGNLSEVNAAGARNVVVVSWLLQQPDPLAALNYLQAAINNPM